MISKRIIYLLTGTVALTIFGCHTGTQQQNNITISPDAGTSYKTGDKVTVKVNYGDLKPDSIAYLIDSVRVGSGKDSSGFFVKTDSLPMGPRTITANIVVLPAKAPEEFTYKVIKKFPHDTSAYTEGLLYQDGYLYESTGNPGHSDLRKVDVATGKVVQRQPIDPKVFGEGSAIIGDKIVMFTYREKIGYVFDKNTFKLLKIFNNNVGVEGWGVTFDGNKMYLDDSTNRIWFLDKNTYNQIGYIDVYDNKGPIAEVNELEYINGKLYSNVYTRDTILVINPKTGAVLQRANMANLWPKSQRAANYDNANNVLNGIAWDAKGKRLFVTGKKWPYVYQVELVKK
jgi:glutamine cyclotransferase